MLKRQIIRGAVLTWLLLSVSFTLSYGQKATVTGTITDEKGETIIGASILVKGTTRGTVSDFNGNYTLELEPGDYTLVFSYLGYATQEHPVSLKPGETRRLDVTLREDVMLLEKVVVVGYGTKMKKDISSSVASLEAEDVENKPVYNFTSALQGKAAGVQITTDNGLAGAPVSVRIRGTKSLTLSSEPLYIVDGIPIISGDISDAANQAGYNTSVLSSINPNEIESIEVLKDAAATAIYGARGASGVVIITTKKGKPGKTRFEVSYNAGASKETNRLKLLNADQYLELLQEAWENDGRPGQAILPFGLTRETVANTDWVDEVLRIGHFQEASLSASGGNEKTTFFLGGTFRDEESFMKGNGFQRASFRSNLSHEASENLSIGMNVGISRTQNEIVPTAWAGGLGMAQSTALPIFPIYNEDGTFFEPAAGVNPVAQLELYDYDNVTYRILANVYEDLRFAKYFNFRNEFGIDQIFEFEETFRPEELTGTDAIAEDRRIFYNTWNYISTLGYKREFGENHNFEALLGFNPTRTIEKFSYIRGSGFPVEGFTQVQNASTIEFATAGTGREFSFVSFFTRLNYELKDRYLFQFSFRRDGSSRFGKNNKWGNFPAFAAGWIISEENFLRNNQRLTFLKLRGSIGTSGNAEIGDFDQYAFYATGQNYGGEPGIGPANIAVDDLSWETTLKSNIGIDLGLWHGRLQATIELYDEHTYDLIIGNRPLAPSSGFSVIPFQNLGTLYNRGIEVSITSNNLGPASPLSWRTLFNITANKNKVVDLGDVKEVSGTNFGDNRAIEGYPVGTWLLAQFAGVDPQTGEEMIYDTLGNVIQVTASNSVIHRVPVGRPYPKFYGGITNTLRWKGLELEFQFVYKVGFNIYDDHGKRQLSGNIREWNQDARVLDRWQQPGDITYVPKLTYGGNRDINTTRHLYDGTFIRLRNLTLAYYLPETVLNRLRLSNAKIYISGINLLVFTRYPGWDPEVNRDKSGSITQSVTYLAPPQAKIISAGFNIGF